MSESDITSQNILTSLEKSQKYKAELEGKTTFIAHLSQRLKGSF